MKIFFMLLMVCFSCLLHSISPFAVIFLIAMSVIWLGIFEYVKYVVQRRGRYPSPCEKNLKYMAFVFLSVLIHPALCLMLVFFFHPFYLSRRLWLNPQVNIISVNRSCVNYRSYSNDSSFSSGEHDFRLVTSGNIIGGSSSYCSDCVTGSLIDISHDVFSVDAEYDSKCGGDIFSGTGFDCGFHDTNPASGMPMIGGVDICGDLYGINSHTDY